MNNQELYPKEKIKDILGYENNYAITTYGRVWSYPKSKHGRGSHCGMWLKHRDDGHGYGSVVLRKNKRCENKKVYRLVAEAFIKNPKNKPEVNHKDGVKKNVYVGNLEWNTRSENCVHAWKIGLCKFTEKQKQSSIENFKKSRTMSSIIKRMKLSYDKAKEIRCLYNTTNVSQRTLAIKYGVCQGMIWNIVNNNTYQEGTFK